MGMMIIVIIMGGRDYSKGGEGLQVGHIERAEDSSSLNHTVMDTLKDALSADDLKCLTGAILRRMTNVPNFKLRGACKVNITTGCIRIHFNTNHPGIKKFLSDLEARPDDFTELKSFTSALRNSCKEFAHALCNDLKPSGLFIDRTCKLNEGSEVHVAFNQSIGCGVQIMIMAFGEASTQDIRRYSLAMLEAEKVWAGMNLLMYCILLESFSRVDECPSEMTSKSISCAEADASAADSRWTKEQSMVDFLSSHLPYLRLTNDPHQNPLSFLKPVRASLFRKILAATLTVPEVYILIEFVFNFGMSPTKMSIHYTNLPGAMEIIEEILSDITLRRNLILPLEESWIGFVAGVQHDLKGDGLAPNWRGDVTFSVNSWNMVYKTNLMEFGLHVKAPVRRRCLFRREENRIWACLDTLMCYIQNKSLQKFNLNKEGAKEGALELSLLRDVPDGYDVDTKAKKVCAIIIGLSRTEPHNSPPERDLKQPCWRLLHRSCRCASEGRKPV